MLERRVLIAMFDFETLSTGDGAAGVYVPDNVQITHVSRFGTTAGSPGTATIDLQDDGTDISGATAIAISANGLTTLTTPASVAAASVIEVDCNLSGGTSPTYTGQIGLWGFVDE